MAIAPGHGADTIGDGWTGWTLQNTGDNDTHDTAESRDTDGDHLAEETYHDRNEGTETFVANTADPAIPSPGTKTTTGGWLVSAVSCEGSNTDMATMTVTYIKWDDNMDSSFNVFAPSLNSGNFPAGTDGFGLSGSLIGMAAGTAGGDIQSLSYSMEADVIESLDKVGDHLAAETVHGMETITETWVGEVDISGLSGAVIDSNEVSTSNSEHDGTVITAHNHVQRT
jgi:hypothetical protein